MSTNNHKILLIEDNPADARLVQELLSESGTRDFDIRWEKNLKRGLKRLAADRFDLLLLDLELPDSHTGLATLEAALQVSHEVPIIVMTGLDDQAQAVRAVASGAQDYLIKGKVDTEALVRSIRYAIERKHLETALRESEERFRVAQELSPDGFSILHPVCDKDGRIEDFTWVYANGATQRMVGKKLEELGGRSLLQMFPGHKRSPFFEAYRHTAETGETRVLEAFYPADGVLPDSWYRAGIIRMGEDIALLSQDITDRKKNEEDLRRAVREAQESQAAVQSYVNRLSTLREIGLTLNQETDRYRLLKSILKSAAEMTSAGAGVMLLIHNNATELVSTYYAPWYESRCATAQDVSALHERIDRLIPDKTRSAFKIRDFPDTGVQSGLPEGHPALRGLLIGRLADTIDRTMGYFLLSEKEAGMDFTHEDEETVSLLASQSSVALVSAENLAREHDIADALQASLLPDIPRHEKLDIGLLYRSASSTGRIGGDFYDFMELEGDKVAFVVGDVCGKGLNAATYTAMVKYTLRAYLEAGMAPGDCLSRLNSVVTRNITPDKFITMGLVILDIGKKTMSYALAGHPEPILSRAGGMIEMSSPRTLPLGVLAEYSFSTLKVSITDDTTLLMYTDGLTEAQSRDREQFGFRRLQTALESRRCLPAQTIARNLVDRVVEFSGNQLQDDVAVVVVRPRLAV